MESETNSRHHFAEEEDESDTRSGHHFAEEEDESDTQSGHHFAEEEDECDGIIDMDAVHGRFLPPTATCIDCKQLVKETDLGDHKLKKCTEGCGDGCSLHRCKAKFKNNCLICGGLVYPYLTLGHEIQFSHSCSNPVLRRGCKFICYVCSKAHDSRKELEQHMGKGSCSKKCPKCHCLMFKKQSVFGVTVDHVCHTL